MSRIVKTHKELQAIVRRMLHAMPKVSKTRIRIAVPLPNRQPRDASGCNWNMPRFGTGTGYADTIETVVRAARERFNLEQNSRGCADADLPPAYRSVIPQISQTRRIPQG